MRRIVSCVIRACLCSSVSPQIRCHIYELQLLAQYRSPKAEVVHVGEKACHRFHKLHRFKREKPRVVEKKNQ
jgi:hypothetical protein